MNPRFAPSLPPSILQIRTPMKTPLPFRPRTIHPVFAAAFLAVVLASPPARAQIYVTSPNNNLSGNTYFEGDAEINGTVYVDGSAEVANNLQADGDITANSVSAWDIYADTLYNNYTASEFTVTGNLELTSGFSSGLSVTPGNATSWLHLGLDVGDLTYTSTDTPAFNISENTDGTYFYPTINFTGYDGNTTWVWQQNGLAGNASLGVQMMLAGNGSLTLNNSADGNSILFSPDNGNIALNNSNGTLTITDANGSSITLDATGQMISFYNGSVTANISPAGTSTVFSTNSTSGQAYGVGASASADYAFALGNGTTASGNGSFAIGNHVTAAYYDSIVLGQWNQAISGSGSGNTTWDSTDPLFVIGNGPDSGDTSNALVMLKSGDTTLNGNLTVNGNTTLNGPSTLNGTANFTGNVSIQPQGDILMGQFNE